MKVTDLPSRVAHVAHALIESSSPYTYGQGPRTTKEVMEYDGEALTLTSTYESLTRAMSRGLCARTLDRPLLWFPTNLALDLRSELEDRYLNEVIW